MTITEQYFSIGAEVDHYGLILLDFDIKEQDINQILFRIKNESPRQVGEEHTLTGTKINRLVPIMVTKWYCSQKQCSMCDLDRVTFD